MIFEKSGLLKLRIFQCTCQAPIPAHSGEFRPDYLASCAGALVERSLFSSSLKNTISSHLLPQISFNIISMSLVVHQDHEGFPFLVS